MQSLSFTPGNARLVSPSPTAPWQVIFEDEGVAAYFYACDRTRGDGDHSILDAVLIYNISSLKDSTSERLAAIEWSPDGLRAAFYLDGTAQALFDFQAREGYARSNFPNFLDSQGENWRRSSHAWSDAALQRFESDLYGVEAHPPKTEN
jgi:hypothetical protein